ncbi:S1 family peptidase [Candidatus Thiosymbion oneisti]|uniref:S1 family peptidase n=1 Tax=Candidatus Thiosymbion oneisti TaxID=589554 RepID=UPI000B7CB798|nr:serine protease [Candidatus Thiosymbion oneisti]
MDWWTDVVFRITGPDAEHRGQGTGFACAREGDAVFVVTCWHVVREIGPERLSINGLPCELVSKEGDDNLDLAVLKVPDLARGEPLTLAPDGAPQMAFKAYGYEPIGRQLSGELGARIYRPHVSHQDVPAWDYYLYEGSRALEKIQDGYSGAPVFDPKGHRVVAVITHRVGTDKGFAIDIANLPRVYSPARAWLSDGEYAATDNPLVKTLDHDQLASIYELLDDNDRLIAWVEACSEDWPDYLADHIHLQPWPAQGQDFREAVPLRLTRLDSAAFRKALLEKVLGTSRAADEKAEQAVVRGWINSTDLRVLYIPVALKRHGRYLPKLIRGAHETLEKLGRFAPGSRVLVLFACIRDGEKPPFWWRLYRLKLARLDCCHTLADMRLLHKPDIDQWLAGFPTPFLRLFKRDWLRAELLSLFPADGCGIRYEQIRRCLIDEGALQQARRNPCP